MKIAVAFENECVFQHFGRTTHFAVYTVNEDNTVNKQVISTNGASHGALSDFLVEQGVDVVICGGLGMGIHTRMVNAGMKVYGGVVGDCDDAVYAYLAGTLEYDPLAAQNHGPCHHHMS